MTSQKVLLIWICTVNVQDKMKAKKYLRKNCYHRIECFAGNSLAAFMWRRPLNSAALVALTYRGPMRVSNGTSTQVVAWTTDKWRAKIIQRDIYNVRDPWWKGNWKIRKEILQQSRTEFVVKLDNQYIRTDLLRLCRGQFYLEQTSLSSFSCHLNPLYLLSNSLKSSFPTHSL